MALKIVTTPSGFVDKKGNVIIDWSANTYASKQTHYELLYKFASGATWNTTGKIASTDKSMELIGFFQSTGMLKDCEEIYYQLICYYDNAFVESGLTKTGKEKSCAYSIIFHGQQIGELKIVANSTTNSYPIYAQTDADKKIKVKMAADSVGQIPLVAINSALASNSRVIVNNVVMSMAKPTPTYTNGGYGSGYFAITRYGYNTYVNSYNARYNTYITGYRTDYVPTTNYRTDYTPTTNYRTDYTPTYTPTTNYRTDYTPTTNYRTNYTPTTNYRTDYTPTANYSLAYYVSGYGYMLSSGWYYSRLGSYRTVSGHTKYYYYYSPYQYYYYTPYAIYASYYYISSYTARYYTYISSYTSRYYTYISSYTARYKTYIANYTARYTAAYRTYINNYTARYNTYINSYTARYNTYINSYRTDYVPTSNYRTDLTTNNYSSTYTTAEK